MMDEKAIILRKIKLKRQAIQLASADIKKLIERLSELKRESLNNSKDSDNERKDFNLFQKRL
jgi:hypothetical protein